MTSSDPAAPSLTAVALRAHAIPLAMLIAVFAVAWVIGRLGGSEAAVLAVGAMCSVLAAALGCALFARRLDGVQIAAGLQTRSGTLVACAFMVMDAALGVLCGARLAAFLMLISVATWLCMLQDPSGRRSVGAHEARVLRWWMTANVLCAGMLLSCAPLVASSAIAAGA